MVLERIRNLFACGIVIFIGCCVSDHIREKMKEINKSLIKEALSSLKTFRYKKMVLLVAEAAVLIVVLVSYFSVKREGVEALDTGISISNFSSDYSTYDGIWYVDNNIEQKDDTEEITLLYGPFIYLPKGNYTLVVRYDCDEDQLIRPYAAEENDSYIISNHITLDRNLNYVSYSFKTTEDINDFEIRTYYNGEGRFYIYDIRLYKNLNGYKKTLYMLFVLFVIFDLFLFNKRWVGIYRKEIFALIAITLFSCLPLLLEGIGYPIDDIDFHLMRIEGLCNELRLDHIPSRIQSLWSAGNGYPVSVFYGDILLYFPAFLRLIGFSISFSYASYVAFINILTVLISYFSFKIIVDTKSISIVMTLVYVTTNTRFATIYVFGQIGESTAMSFLPLGAAAMYLLYADERKTTRLDIKAATLLAVAMTGIILSHILSAIMAVEVILIFSLICIKKTIRVRTLLSYFASILLTVVLSMFFIIPFLDYYKNVSVLINKTGGVPNRIQEAGMSLYNIMAFFQNPYLVGNKSKTPGLILITTLIIACVLWLNYGARHIRTISVISLIIIFLASELFPWNWIASVSKIGNSLSQIQFPTRYLGFVCVILTVLLGLLLNEMTKKETVLHYIDYPIIIIIVVMLSLISFSVLLGYYAENATFYNTIDKAEIPDDTRMGGEYVRVDADGEPIYYVRKNIESVNAEVEILAREGWTLDMKVHTEDSPGLIKTPFTNYKGYQAFDSDGNHFDIIDDEYCKASFIIPGNYNGLIRVTFVEPWFWKVSEIISFCAWIGLIGFCAFYCFVKRRRKLSV